jgi:hypothetical protein
VKKGVSLPVDSVGSGITIFDVFVFHATRIVRIVRPANASSRVTAVVDPHPTEIRPQFESDDVRAPI